jgi:hypothetical protein
VGGGGGGAWLIKDPPPPPHPHPRPVSQRLVLLPGAQPVPVVHRSSGSSRATDGPAATWVRKRLAAAREEWHARPRTAAAAGPAGAGHGVTAAVSAALSAATPAWEALSARWRPHAVERPVVGEDGLCLCPVPGCGAAVSNTWDDREHHAATTHNVALEWAEEWAATQRPLADAVAATVSSL